MKAHPPKQCDICAEPFEGQTELYDAKTIHGPWAWLCRGCIAKHGVGLGTGKGQKYERAEDGTWEKTDG